MDCNISTKGSDDMTPEQQIDKLVAEYNGIIQTSKAVELGISKPLFYQYIKENGLDKIAHGVYATQDTWIDAMFLVHLRCKQAVFSHETALFFHDLTDREPSAYTITVKTGYNPSKLKADGIQVYTIKQELHKEGMIMAQTPFGHAVPVYNMERTICDIIRNRSNVEIQTLKNALKHYTSRKDKNLRQLMRYATMFRIERILRQYLEVLL